MLAATGSTVAFLDADLAYPPEQLIGLLEAVEAGADVVVGSRRHVDTVTLAKARRIRGISGRVFNWLTRAVVLGETRDTQCGIKAFSAPAARLIFERSRVDGFAFDVEIFVIARALGLDLQELPVELTNTRRSSVSLGRDAGRMVRDLTAIRWRMARGGYGRAERDSPPTRLGSPWPDSTRSSRPMT
jgi:glycosyltransferase involved in cell wall biosynthesis